MTVQPVTTQSINQGAIAQGNASTSQSSQAITPEMAFANALQSALCFSGMGLPSVTATFKGEFDTSAKAAARQSAPAPTSSASQPAPVAQQSDTPQSSDAPPAPAQQAAAPPPSSDNRPVRSSDDQSSDAAAPTQGNDQNAPTDGATVAAQQVVAQIQQQVLAVPVQQTDPQGAAPAAGQGQASPVNDNHDPFAWLERDHGDSIGALENQLTAQSTGTGDTASFDASLAQANADAAVAGPAFNLSAGQANTATTAKANTHGSGQSDSAIWPDGRPTTWPACWPAPAPP